MYLLFTTPPCPYCPQAKRKLEASGIHFDLIDASTNAGRQMAIEYGIHCVPTLLRVDEQGILVERFDGIEEIMSSPCVSQDSKK